jgi:glycosyltransferase involved in cell wall biosynthesis
MKILFVNDFSPGHTEASGAELVIRSLRRNCEALGHNTRLATCHGESDFKVPGRTLGAWMNPRNKSAEKSFKNILKQLEPDIVHFHNIRHVGLSPLKATLERGTACLYSLHDYLPLCPQRTMYTKGSNCTHFEDCFKCFYGSARQWHIRTVASLPIHPVFNRVFLKPLRSNILRVLNQVQKTVPTTEMRTRLERFGLRRSKVVTPGIDFEHQPNPNNGRKLVALPEHACIIGYYGRFSSEKGITLLSQTWRMIERKFPSAYLLTTGKKHLSRGANELTSSRVIHLGKLREDTFLDVVSTSNIVVAPSVWEEPFNLSVSTALAMGKPVVATAVGGHIEQVTHGVNGFLSRTEPSEFASYIAELIKDEELRHRMGRAGRKTYVAKLTGRSCALSCLQIYRSLMSH